MAERICLLQQAQGGICYTPNIDLCGSCDAMTRSTSCMQCMYQSCPYENGMQYIRGAVIFYFFYYVRVYEDELKKNVESSLGTDCNIIF